MTSMTSAAVSSRNAYIKYLRKTVRALFPVFKEKGQPLADVTEKLTLQFNHELEVRLQNIGIGVLPAGVLEPWASGVIAYCVGTSTNQLRWFRLANRGFVVRGRLGSETTTFDASGDVVETQPYHHVSPEAVERALDRFRGHFLQDVPPPRDGSAASPVAPIQRPVVCHAIACAQLDLPDFSLEIESGPGFSPRVFVRDLGRALGSRACLTSLEQVRQGPFTLEHALPSYRWSWEEASATSRKLADLWGPCIAQVRQEMEHQRKLFEGRARYY